MCARDVLKNKLNIKAKVAKKDKEGLLAQGK